MFLAAAKRTPVNLEEWAVQMMERHNRKSHLAPQLSPSTQALLRGETTMSPSKETSTSTAARTPTSGDIPIVEQDSRALPIPDISQLDINGAYSHQSQSTHYEQFPPRSSSGFPQNPSRSRDVDAYSPNPSNARSSSRETNYTTTTTLPIRPAPPPTGPLPQPPTTAFRNPNHKRPTTNGSAFPYSDPSQF